MPEFYFPWHAFYNYCLEVVLAFSNLISLTVL